jgi:hypothetical protein
LPLVPPSAADLGVTKMMNDDRGGKEKEKEEEEEEKIVSKEG